MNLRSARAAALYALLWGAAGTPAARADEPVAPSEETEPTTQHRLRWNPEWRRFEAVDYVSTAAIGAAYAYVEFGTETPTDPRWEGPILFDEAIRDALNADTAEGRNRAGHISDPLWYGPMLFPHLEAAVVPLFFDDWNWEIAWQLTTMNLQAAAISGLIMRAGHRFVARARPDVAPCEQDPDYDENCFGGSNAGFPSGHVAGGMTGVGLACAHHSHLPFYGGGAPEIAVCATLVALSTGNGVTRLIADRHYASDVIAGAIIGFGIGFGAPTLLHYGGVGSFGSASSAARAVVVPYADRERVGLRATGLF